MFEKLNSLKAIAMSLVCTILFWQLVLFANATPLLHAVLHWATLYDYTLTCRSTLLFNLV